MKTEKMLVGFSDIEVITKNYTGGEGVEKSSQKVTGNKEMRPTCLMNLVLKIRSKRSWWLKGKIGRDSEELCIHSSSHLCHSFSLLI